VVKRLLADGDAVGERVVRPTDVVYQVHEEMGSGLGPDSPHGGKSITQSLQLWSPDQPWRLYEEVVNYYGVGFKRHVLQRSWLVASGRGERYAPKWHVGDWWVVKTWQQRPPSGLRPAGDLWRWDYRRYDVARIDKVGRNDCYVLEIRGDERPNIGRDGAAGAVLYVRTDNWLVVRTEEANFYSGKRLSPYVRDYPRGLFGPFISEPRLPGFPLHIMNPDTAFKKERRDDCYANLREISRPADPELVKRLLAEGDTAGGPVIRPKGAVYDVRSELGGDYDPGSPTGRRDITQSHQLWSDDLPWRIYEERVGYNGWYGGRSVEERSWLVAVGQGEK